MVALFAAAMAICTYASTSVYVADFEIAPSQSSVVSIMANNDHIVSAAQFDIYLPEGLELQSMYDEGEEDNIHFFKSDRMRTNHSIVYAPMTDETGRTFWRLMIASSTSQNLKGNSGELVYFRVKADKDFNGGDLAIENVVLYENDGHTHYNPASTTCKVEKNPTTGIDELNDAANVNGPIFDILGRRILKVESGQIYFQKGKKGINK